MIVRAKGLFVLALCTVLFPFVALYYGIRETAPDWAFTVRVSVHALIFGCTGYGLEGHRHGSDT